MLRAPYKHENENQLDMADKDLNPNDAHCVAKSQEPSITTSSRVPMGLTRLINDRFIQVRPAVPFSGPYNPRLLLSGRRGQDDNKLMSTWVDAVEKSAAGPRATIESWAVIS